MFLLLGLPAFGVSLAYTVVTTYVPVLIERLSGPALTGLLIGGEGVLSLLIPLVVGGWSDVLRTRWGGRLPFVAAGAAVAVVGLLALPAVAGSLPLVAMMLGVFFVGYFVYYAPYYALYPDLVPRRLRGRSQGTQGGLRSLGLLTGIAGGGYLLHAWLPLPFVLAAVAVAAVTTVLVLRVRHRPELTHPEEPVQGGRNGFRVAWRLLRRDPALRVWMVANACWEAAIAALRTFVVLYFTIGLGLSLPNSSAGLALVGAVAVLAAPVSGSLADRFGARPVMTVALVIFALGMLPTQVTTDTTYMLAILPIGFAAVVLMTLPYTLLMDMLPDGRSNGAAASLFSASRGVGVVLGPLLAGAAAQYLSGAELLSFAATKGYAAVFTVSMLFLVISLPLLRRLDTLAREKTSRAGGYPREIRHRAR